MATTNKIAFHVYSEGRPDNLLPLFQAINSENVTFTSISQIEIFANEFGIAVPKQWNVLPTACNLLAKNDDGLIQLSDYAKAIISLPSNSQADIIHYLLYTTWDAAQPATHAYLWTYRQVVDTLWQRRNFPNLATQSQEIAEEVYNASAVTFAEVPEYDFDKVSISDKTIRGVRKWLEALQPPVIDQSTTFNRRDFCMPELLLLACGWVAQTTGGEPEIDFLLTPERREKIAKLCLLEPNSLDSSLKWVLAKYRSIIQSGTGAGTYGRFVRFIQWPQVTDLIP